MVVNDGKRGGVGGLSRIMEVRTRGKEMGNGA